jgi:hypothetical protein
LNLAGPTSFFAWCPLYPRRLSPIREQGGTQGRFVAFPGTILWLYLKKQAPPSAKKPGRFQQIRRLAAKTSLTFR